MTPPVAADELMGNVFFLDPQHGWAETSREKHDGSGESVFRTFATADGGTTWTAYPMLLDCRACIENSFASDVMFVDPQHGWIVFDIGGNFRGGVLFATADGGRTWVKQDFSLWSGRLRFINNSDGWIVSSKMTGAPLELYATRDGARSWQKQAFAAPPGLAKRASGWFNPPVFTSPSTGSLAVSFSDQYRSIVALYNTEDAGLHWTKQHVFPPVNAKVTKPVMAEGHVIFAYSKAGRLVVAQDGIDRPPSQRYPLENPVEVQFTDAQHGWILLVAGECRGFKCDCYQASTLVRTADGGNTFIVIDPGIGPPAIISACGANRTR